MTAEVKRDRLAFSNRQTVGGNISISQQLHGLTLCSQSNGVRKGFVLLAATCGDILAFLDTVGAICVLGRDEAVSAVAI